MHIRVFIVFLISIFILTACNLGASPNQGEEEISTADPQNAGQPEVTILSPTTGASFTINEQVLVSVSATDQIGITRVQLFANGSLVKTVSSEFAQGEVSYEGVLDFTPRTNGDYNLRVIAFRNAISSPPADLQITVGAAQIIVTERSSGSTTGSSTGSTTGNPVPVIPNDGVCRVLTLVGLNMRTQPTTIRDNVIRTFASNTLLNVVARLSDNSWWKVSSGTTVGWVSGNLQYVSQSGNCNSIPIETVVLNTPTPSPTPLSPTITPVPATPVPGVPDLIVPNIAIDDVVEIPTGDTEVTVEVTITVKNNGNGGSGQFDVILTVERNGFDDVIYDVSTVGNLDPGAIVTLTVDVTFDAVDDYEIQVDADPGNTVAESGEFNNRADTNVEVINAP